jgi:predicted nuclease of predicted toxin-antitoxin system
MRVLVDECVDWRLIRELQDHEVKSVKQLGWERVKNGALLTLAAQHFDVFISVDKDLPHQQNIRNVNIAVIILRGRTTRLRDLQELLGPLREALKAPETGTFRVLHWRNVADDATVQ